MRKRIWLSLMAYLSLCLGCAESDPSGVDATTEASVGLALQGRWEAIGPEGTYVLEFDGEQVQLAVGDQVFDAVPYDVLERGDTWARLNIHHAANDAEAVVTWQSTDEMTLGWMDDWVFARSRY